MDLLIPDDFGLRPITEQGVEDLYEVIHCRYERGSIILTSNRAPSEWGEVFGDAPFGHPLSDQKKRRGLSLDLSCD